MSMETREIIKYVIYIILILGVNVGFTYLLNKFLDNAWLISVLSYFSFFISFMIIYFLFFGFEFHIFFGFLLALFASVVIAVFILIFMSPSYCQDKSESNMGIYAETLLYGLLAYLIYYYFSSYVKPFYTYWNTPNKIQPDLVFTGIIGTIFLIIYMLNRYVKSESFNTINFYTFLLYIFILSMKIYVIIYQYIYPVYPESGSMMGGYDYLVREPDYIRFSNQKYNRRGMKSAFYNFR